MNDLPYAFAIIFINLAIIMSFKLEEGLINSSLIFMI